MKKQIKVIKRGEDRKISPSAKTTVKRPSKKEPTVAETIKGWISERRENNDAEDRTRRKQFSSWNSDKSIHATSA
jgi:hypothetical protein